MLRCEQNTIIFLINNGGYTIEIEIHDEPYNAIKNWNYTALVDAIHNGDGKSGGSDCLCFIEIIVHKDDTKVCSANSRPPNPQ
ncbi:hypothetical protein MKX01_020297 [Papaver californicum]|nr:hypothetical protein MKX01_020297 [Papaver californicum]